MFRNRNTFAVTDETAVLKFVLILYHFLLRMSKIYFLFSCRKDHISSEKDHIFNEITCFSLKV